MLVSTWFLAFDEVVDENRTPAPWNDIAVALRLKLPIEPRQAYSDMSMSGA